MPRRGPIVGGLSGTALLGNARLAVALSGGKVVVRDEIPLPDLSTRLLAPLVVKGRLIGVLAVGDGSQRAAPNDTGD